MSHPIIPPLKLVTQWMCAAARAYEGDETWIDLANHAACWGADQELEECVEWLIANGNSMWAVALQAARRPKPPSLAEQALELINKIQGDKKMWQLDELDVVRAALERLQELEKGDE